LFDENQQDHIIFGTDHHAHNQTDPTDETDHANEVEVHKEMDIQSQVEPPEEVEHRNSCETVDEMEAHGQKEMEVTHETTEGMNFSLNL